MQGISTIQPFFSNIRLENICEYNDLQTNSLRAGAGNFFGRAGNQFRFAGICGKSTRAPGRG
jgi:hypothetical protein